MNKTFPASTGTESYYHTIDNAFSPASEYDMDTAFITNRRERDCIRQRAYQREIFDRQRMAEELNRDSQFSEGQDRDSYNSYLLTESDRKAIISKQHHMEKLEREHQARWFINDRKSETSNSVLDDMNRESTPFSTWRT